MTHLTGRNNTLGISIKISIVSLRPGVLRGRAGGTWWRPQHGLRVEVLLQLLQLLQGMLLQRPQHLLRHPAGACAGGCEFAMITFQHVWHITPLSACFHGQLRLRAEVFRHVPPVLSGSRLWNGGSAFQQHRSHKRIKIKDKQILSLLLLIVFIYHHSLLSNRFTAPHLCAACARSCVYVCVCVRACVRACVCACVVCVRARARNSIIMSRHREQYSRKLCKQFLLI